MPDDSWVPIHIQLEMGGEARMYVLSLGSRIEVLEPVGLCKRVAREAQEVIDLYVKRSGPET